MGFGFKQPLVVEKRCVTTLLTAAKETTRALVDSDWLAINTSLQRNFGFVVRLPRPSHVTVPGLTGVTYIVSYSSGDKTLCFIWI